MSFDERIFKALANRRRLAIIRLLINIKRLAVGDIARHLKVTLPTTSKHLSILAGVDILEYDKESLVVYYRLADNLPALVRDIIKHLR